MVRPTAGETRLHAEGAEFLVLGHLLIRGVHASKAYVSYPDWDILATNIETDKNCRVQVKARLGTDYDGGFPIKSFRADFVVHVALNRGYRYRRARDDTPLAGEQPPRFFVLPMGVVQDAAATASKWGQASKIFLRRLPDPEAYEDAWHLITDHLGAPELPGPELEPVET